MSCSVGNLGLIAPYLQTPSVSNPTIWWVAPWQATTTNSQEQRYIALPVLNTIQNEKLSPQDQRTTKSLSMIQRSLPTSNPSINESFNLLKEFQPSNQEQKQGITNIFAGADITLGDVALNNGILTLKLEGINKLSQQQGSLISVILQQFYTQFSGIHSVVITQ